MLGGLPEQGTLKGRGAPTGGLNPEPILSLGELLEQLSEEFAEGHGRLASLGFTVPNICNRIFFFCCFTYFFVFFSPYFSTRFFVCVGEIFFVFAPVFIPWFGKETKKNSPNR